MDASIVAMSRGLPSDSVAILIVSTWPNRMEWSPETLIFGGATDGVEVFAGPRDIFAGAGAPSILTANPDATIPATARIGRNPREEKKMYASSGLGDVM